MVASRARFRDAIPPAAAWIAVKGTLDWRILPLVGAVTFWVGGFDVLYACQDYDFDCQIGLHSIPRWLGIRKALITAQIFHLITIGFLAWTSYLFGLGVLGWIAVLVFAAMLIYEHSLVSHEDLSRLDAAFFTTNGVVSVLYFLFVATAVLVRK